MVQEGTKVAGNKPQVDNSSVCVPSPPVDDKSTCASERNARLVMENGVEILALETKSLVKKERLNRFRG